MPKVYQPKALFPAGAGVILMRNIEYWIIIPVPRRRGGDPYKCSTIAL